ncbi:uncharacterized protein PHALS_04981 [Plasmopara halstedii]|uniref:Uncharacterized protein n=1 Tax=Plasmopara halstedii TaxID=4781 RepID=A0A0N7L412_PLAHL|nr:uncharacterized protein PHALS_04981 [Plasmopara halstedii]CEG37387.1 hypothetical protein PHALS_04981 [Plasmopara halstedii]|eukprot:XP_024573756.1 hypothetical protein PHALS_04981 [Plasmopara halstedii]
MLSSSSLSPSASATRPFASVSLTPEELPKLKISVGIGTQHQRASRERDAGAAEFDVVPPIPTRTDAAVGSDTIVPHRQATQSLASPASNFTPRITKFGLSPLIEAAERVRHSTTEIRNRRISRSSLLKRGIFQLQTLPSTMHTMGSYPLETSTTPKRACMRADNVLNMQASYSLLSCRPQQETMRPKQSKQLQPYNVRPTKTLGLDTVSNLTKSNGLSHLSGVSVWKVVLITGNFPQDICFSENGTSPVVSLISNKFDSESKDGGFTVKADESVDTNLGQWSGGGGIYIDAFIQAVQGGLLQKVDDGKLKGISTNIGNKARILSGSTHHVDTQVAPGNASYNPLSLSSIMNDESSSPIAFNVPDNVKACAISNELHRSPSSGLSEFKIRQTTAHRVLKRSDYSQHGTVRSGRWSEEEECYAKAMIDAFKAGYLPLHGNVSLRKFLSEMLLCHPMRISKKFVGYVRKYHYYRVAAGTCDPGVRAQVLNQLSYLEHAFWKSQQNNEWCNSFRRDE